MSRKSRAAKKSQDDLFTEEQSENFTDPIDVLSDDAPDIEVSVIDDTPEEDRNRPPRAEVTENLEEDIPGLSDRVKTRFDTLRYEFHNERREKESAQRENNEAVRYAQNVQTENKELKEDKVLVEEQVLKVLKVHKELKELKEDKVFKEL